MNKGVRGSHVTQLIEVIGGLGEVAEDQAWPDYGQYSYNADSIPALMAMIVDYPSYMASDDAGASWVPLHAWRALGQLAEPLAIKPLINQFNALHEDDWAYIELPQVLAMHGAEALEPLSEFMASAGQEEFARAMALEALVLLLQESPELQPQIAQAFQAYYDNVDKEQTAFNALVVGEVIDLEMLELEDTIEAMYKKRVFDTDVCGKIAYIRTCFASSKKRLEAERLRDAAAEAAALAERAAAEAEQAHEEAETAKQALAEKISADSQSIDSDQAPAPTKDQPKAQEKKELKADAQPKSKAKLESKPESKPKSKPEAKPETKTAAKADGNAKSKTAKAQASDKTADSKKASPKAVEKKPEQKANDKPEKKKAEKAPTPKKAEQKSKPSPAPEAISEQASESDSAQAPEQEPASTLKDLDAPLERPSNPDDVIGLLDYYFDRYSTEESIFSCSELDGFCHAIASAPNIIEADDWLPIIWGLEGKEPEWKSKIERSEFIDLTFSVFNHAIENLDRGQPEPLFYEPDENGKTYDIANEWCAGFLRGGGIWPEIDEADVQLVQDPIDVIKLFATEEGFEQLDKMTDKELAQKQSAVLDGVQAIYSHFKKLRNKPVVNDNKVGRNDPCPCGSGKKYKKCCGKA